MMRAFVERFKAQINTIAGQSRLIIGVSLVTAVLVGLNLFYSARNYTQQTELIGELSVLLDKVRKVNVSASLIADLEDLGYKTQLALELQELSNQMAVVSKQGNQTLLEERLDSRMRAIDEVFAQIRKTQGMSEASYQSRMKVLAQSLVIESELLKEQILAYNSQALSSLQNDAMSLFSWVTVSVTWLLLIMGALAWAVNRRVLQPLKDLVWFAEKVGAGEPLPPVYSAQKNEFGQTQQAVKAMAERLTTQNQHLEKLSRFNRSFVSTVSHEIRTPLNSIMGTAMLGANSRTAEESREALSIIEQSSRHLLALVNDVMDYEKLQAGGLTLAHSPLSLEKCAKQINSLFSVLSKAKNIDLLVTLDDSLKDLPLLGDATRLFQVLTNLVGNAVKFTEKGSVEIEFTEVERRADAVKVCIAVEDTGVGIAQEDIANIFIPFRQSQSTRYGQIEGTGLGLSVSTSLLQLMESELKVFSKIGVGSCFTFELWLDIDYEALHERAQSGQEKAQKVQIAKPLILMVDDHPLNLKINARLIETLGYEVETADSGPHALEKLESTVLEGRRYHAILTDIHMAPMDGTELAQAIRARLGEACPLMIAVTAGVLPEEKDRILAAGISDILAKPFDMETARHMLEVLTVN